MFTGAYYAGYLKGWYANSDKVNSEHKVKNKKSEKAVATVEQKTAAASNRCGQQYPGFHESALQSR